MEQQEKTPKQAAIEVIQTIVNQFNLSITDMISIETCMEEPEEKDAPESVNDKNYTIVEFRAKDATQGKLVLKENGHYGEIEDEEGSVREIHMLRGMMSVESGSFEIYKVRRNNDGVEWTLGDSVLLYGEDGPKAIEKFEIAEQFSGGMAVEVKEAGKTAIKYLPAPVVNKEPIMVTADGVEIYDKHQIIYGVSEDWSTLNQSVEGTQVLLYEHMINGKWYSTEAARAQYIQENEPRYTLKDVESAWEEGFYTTTGGPSKGWNNYKENKLGIK